jgi:phage shock protein PspC (stress-responsive transcriptional regulator)
MKQVININFHGQVVPIEVTAFDLLKNYTESLSRYFANEEGKEEIINDIESRIGELFQERLKKGSTCITDDDVNAIIKSMGSPEELEEVDEIGSSKPSSGKQTKGQDQFQFQSGNSNRLFRNENDKIIGGICGGLANYFNIDPILVRIIFIVLLFAGGAGFLAYLILWIALPSSASTEIGSTRKKLFRDPDEKIIAGVCSGVGNYFGVSAWIPRVLFLLPFLGLVFRWSHNDFMDFPHFISFSFSPGSLIVYIILWLVIPQATNTAEKLEMKGEKVDLHSIKNLVVDEMKDVQQRAEKLGKEARSFAEDKSKELGADATNLVKRTVRSLGDIIVLLVKAFAYFIIGCFAFALVVALFAFAIFSIGIFPLKDFLLTDGWQNIFAWGTLFLFIAVPVIGIITWVIRRLAKIKSNRRVLRFTFFGLWLIGLVCFISLLISVGKDFRSTNNIFEQDVYLTNPLVKKLELTTQSPTTKYYRNNIFRLEPFEIFGLDEDTAVLKNVEIKILKSPTDSFRVTMVKMANGSNRRSADTLANRINYGAVQNDSILLLDKGIAITRKNKFRNQRVIVTIYVPVGKKIRIGQNLHFDNPVYYEGLWKDDQYNIEDDGEETGWEPNIDYIMKPDGLYTLDGIPADMRKGGGKNNMKIDGHGIYLDKDGNKISIDINGIQIIEGNEEHTENSASSKTLDSLRMKMKIEQMRIRDSLQKAKEKIQQQIEKIAISKTSPEALSGYYLQSYFLLVNNID